MTNSNDTVCPQVEVSLIAPVYNECESLTILHEKITAVMQQLGMAWEIIYIDDGSTDGSIDVLRGLYEKDSHVVLAVQRRNFGKSLALALAFALARGRILVTLDADLQDEPAEIPNLLAKLDEGYDIVSGWKHERQDPLTKRIPSWIANRVTSMTTGLRLHDMNSGLKAYRADCVKNIQLYGDLHRYIPVMAHLAGFRVGEIPVVHHERKFGQSKYGVERLLRGGLDLMTVLFLNQYGRRPLHLFGGGGAVLFLLGLGINLVLSVQWFLGDRNLSERPLLQLGILLIVLGVQFMMMGLLAELLVSHIQRQENPLNTAKQIYRAPDDNETSGGEKP